jgi:hypothetical protein
MPVTPTNERLSAIAAKIQKWSEGQPRREQLVPLSVRVPIHVSRELDSLVYTAKMQGKRITKQQIVTYCLMQFLGMSS